MSKLTCAATLHWLLLSQLNCASELVLVCCWECRRAESSFSEASVGANAGAPM